MPWEAIPQSANLVGHHGSYYAPHKIGVKRKRCNVQSLEGGEVAELRSRHSDDLKDGNLECLGYRSKICK